MTGIGSRAFGEAIVANDAETLKELEAVALAAVERTDVTAVYVFEVRIVDGRAEPVSVRERIRAALATTV